MTITLLVLSAIALFYCFLIYTIVAPKWTNLHWTTKLVFLPVIVVFGPLDVILFNWILGTIFYRELPLGSKFCWTFSKRLVNHLRDTDWTGPITRWIWNEYILHFDPNHMQKAT